jgi:hypothetical protein
MISQATKDRVNAEAPGTSVYADHGYESRFAYLESLSDDYNVPMDQLIELADVLGSEEDFDGLVVAAEDFERYS